MKRSDITLILSNILLHPKQTMVKKATYLSLSMLMCILLSVLFSACGDDDDDEPSASSPIVGTWVCDYSDATEYDIYTLVFLDNNTGCIRNEYGTRTAIAQQMNFDWSLTPTSDGYYLLSVIYKSGDRYMDGPFEGGYAQYNRRVTIAGNTLSIHLDGNYGMLCNRQ